MNAAIPSSKIAEASLLLSKVSSNDMKTDELIKEMKGRETATPPQPEREYDIVENNDGTKLRTESLYAHELIAIMRERRAILVEQLAEIGVVVEDVS